MSDSTIMSRLKQATRDLHRYAETRELQRRIARGTVSRDRFAEYLGQLYLMHEALESALARAGRGCGVVASVATPERMRLPALRQDLEYHGLDPECVAALPATTAFTSRIEGLERDDPTALLGCLYVLEGSTNGSRFLAAVLRDAWSLADAGLAYLDPYGEEQPARWKSFKRAMDGQEFSSRERESIVDAARFTFSAVADASDQVLQAIAA